VLRGKVRAMNPPADFMIFGGELASRRANGSNRVEILNEGKLVRKVFHPPARHDWSTTMGAK